MLGSGAGGEPLPCVAVLFDLVDEGRGEVTRGDLRLVFVIHNRTVACRGPVITGFVPWHEVVRRRAHVSPPDAVAGAENVESLRLRKRFVAVLLRETRVVYSAYAGSDFEAAATADESES